MKVKVLVALKSCPKKRKKLKKMKVLGSRFCMLMVIAFVISSCVNHDSPVSKTKPVDSPVKDQIEASQVPSLECYSEEDLRSLEESDLLSVLKMISRIREVKDFSLRNKKYTSYCVTEDLLVLDSYRIQVGREDETHFSTSYIFYVNKNTKDLKVLEVLRDSLMSLEDWRNASWRK